MDGNYIKLSRNILDWQWYSDINTTRLFIHCLLKANWKDKQWKGILIGRGQFPTSFASLEKELGLTTNELRTSIKHLQTTGEITKKSHGKFSVITVKNYDLYQSDNKQNYSESTSENTINSQPINNLLTTLEERKNINNISVRVCERFEDFWAAYPKNTGRILAEQAYASLIQTVDEQVVIDAAVNYANSCKILKTNTQFMKNPANWINDGMWTEYTAEHYKPPAPKTGIQQQPKKNSFNGYENQRNYNYDELEKQLLNANRGDDN